MVNKNSIYVKKLNSKIMDKPSRINCLLKRRNSGKSFCNFSIQYSTALYKRSCQMLVYNDLRLQVLKLAFKIKKYHYPLENLKTYVNF